MPSPPEPIPDDEHSTPGLLSGRQQRPESASFDLSPGCDVADVTTYVFLLFVLVLRLQEPNPVVSITWMERKYEYMVRAWQIGVGILPGTPFSGGSWGAKEWMHPFPNSVMQNRGSG